jgi:AraC family transcriptional regulator of adaptative response/methylated-DNA-[protein]-cysteine methyltransferase
MGVEVDLMIDSVTLLQDRPLTADDETRWRAFEARDTRYDGAFVVAVRTTGIYCRPSCPARRPKRENVRFYPLADAAESAGYRPCRRCRPREVAPQIELARRACEHIDAHLDEPLTLASLGAALDVSPHHLQRTFTRVIGISPREYADARRLELLKTGLRDGDSVTTAMYDAGYGSSSRLYERAPAQLGMTPGVYRRGGEGMRISYTIVPSPLGRLLVAATGRGVCFISLADADDTLEDALHGEYPAAEIQPDSGGLGTWVRIILDHLAGRQPHLDLPLDIQATAFQRRVWEELRAIPYGSTRSYAEVARAVGQPTAVRAVARACATNPVPLVVPCHRVVREDGSLAGYRWGVERKRALLEYEREHTQAAR